MEFSDKEKTIHDNIFNASSLLLMPKALTLALTLTSNLMS